MRKDITAVDVAILGAGGGGYPAAFLLARAGLQVLMVDPFGNLGGDCLAEGCVPSKAVREASLARALAFKYGQFGLHGQVPEADWRAVLAHKDRVQQLRYQQHTEEMRESSVIFCKGYGRILDEHQVEILTSDGQQLSCQHRYLIIATGSRPHLLPIPGVELAMTSHDLFRLGADVPFPQHLVVIGGGYSGVEVASMLNNLGGRATVLEYLEQLLPGADAELGQVLYEELSKRVRVELKAQVTALEKITEGVRVHYRQSGQAFSVDGDAVLMAAGRESVLPEGMERLGIEARRPLAVDSQMRTQLAHIYAPGDVNGRSMLFHSAVRQSLVAAHNILGGGQALERMNFLSVPFTVFTEPEIAWVGLTEAQARAQDGDVQVVRYEYVTDSRAQIFNEMRGFIKLVFASQTSRLLGAQIAGMDAAQVIAPLALAVQEESTAATLVEVPFPHPMISEGINKAARQFRP